MQTAVCGANPECGGDGFFNENHVVPSVWVSRIVSIVTQRHFSLPFTISLFSLSLFFFLVVLVYICLVW
jgi:hypothetical protein